MKLHILIFFTEVFGLVWLYH